MPPDGTAHLTDPNTLDCSSEDQYKVCPRLTDQNVVKGKIKKMKVSFAAQVFSQRVSSVLRRLASWSVGHVCIYLLYYKVFFDDFDKTAL